MIKQMLQSSFLRLSSVVFIGNLAAQFLIFLAYALFARFFEMIDIGIYTVFISLSILLAVPSTGRYELAIMLPKQKKEAQGLLKLALSLSLVFSLLVWVLLYSIPFEIYISRLAKIEELILWLPAGVFLMASFQSFIIYHNSKGEFKLNAFMKTIQAALLLGLSFVYTYFFAFSSYTLVIAWITSQAVVNILYTILLFTESIKHSFEDLKQLMLEYKRYPIVSLPSNFVNTFSVELPNYFIPAFWGAGVQTLYAYGARVAGMPRNFIGSAIGDVFFKRSSDLAVDEPQNLVKHLRKVSLLLIGFSSLIYIAGILLADILFPLVFGADYIDAVPYFRWLALASIFLFVQSPISTISDVINRLDAPLIFNLVSVMIKTGVLLWAGYRLASPVHMIMLYSVSTALLALFWIVYLQYLTKREITNSDE